MSNKEHIEAVLSLYKSAIRSYSWEHHYRDNKPLEGGFNRQIMIDTTSSLYDAVNSLFVELTPSQADRYISIWSRQYIIQGWCANDDRVSYNRLQAIGQKFVNECKRIAAEMCEPEPQGETTQRGGGVDHPTKVQQKKTQIEKPSFELPNILNTYKARKIYLKAKNKGLIYVVDNGLKWSDTNALLAFLCGIVYCDDTRYQDKLTKEWIIKRGSSFFPNKELNTLFGVKNLGQSRTQLNRLPKGYEKILELTEGS